jgi:hypothetical protein
MRVTLVNCVLQRILPFIFANAAHRPFNPFNLKKLLQIGFLQIADRRPSFSVTNPKELLWHERVVPRKSTIVDSEGKTYGRN